MSSNWKDETLTSISSSVSYGYTASACDDKVGPKFLRITDIQGGIVNWNDVPYCKIDNRLLSRYCLKHGDIVVARTGNSTGENFLFTESETTSIFASYLIRFEINQAIAYPQFVWYHMRSQNWWHFISGAKTGSAQAGANAKTLGEYKIKLPSLTEQKAIADILVALDRKIELNRQMCKTLEDIASALFKSWFIDFDPVKAKAKGREPPSLRPEIATLFPDSFIDSPLGQIPFGWKVGKLKDEFNLLMGQSPPGESYNENGLGIPFFQGTRDFGFRYPSNRVFCSNPTRIAKTSDTLVSVRAPVGEVNMTLEKCCIGRGVAALKHKKSMSSYTFYMMKNLKDNFKSYEANGTVFGAINKKEFESIDLIVPGNILIIDEFETIIRKLDKKIEECSKQITSLSKIIDNIIPKLITGDIQVKDIIIIE